jgi:hypothetical protein
VNENYGGSNDQTFLQQLHIISPGGADNCVVQALIHLTVNATGDVTADTSIFDVRSTG